MSLLRDVKKAMKQKGWVIRGSDEGAVVSREMPVAPYLGRHDVQGPQPYFFLRIELTNPLTLYARIYAGTTSRIHQWKVSSPAKIPGPRVVAKRLKKDWERLMKLKTVLAKEKKSIFRQMLGIG